MNDSGARSATGLQLLGLTGVFAAGIVLIAVLSSYRVTVAGTVAVSVLAAAATVDALILRQGRGSPRLRGAPAGPLADQPFPFHRLIQLRRELADGAWESASDVRELIGFLATERLKRNHGVDPGRQPDTARALMGDELWTYVREPPDAPGRPVVAMERLIARLGQL